MQVKPIKQIIIVGGGTAGWLTAGILAADHNCNQNSGIDITLIESPDINTIGVGEGTWPTMRNTLQGIGISENEFIQCCDASFKQGSQFVGWVTGKPDDKYYHPFTLPNGFGSTEVIAHWQSAAKNTSFANAVSFQAQLCDEGFAPKQLVTPEYAAVANYGYHLNAAKFADLLKKHCIEKLGVKHLSAHVKNVQPSASDDIKSLETDKGVVAGDFFIDCSGTHALLIGKHFQIPFIDKQDILFNDTALAVQVPYEDDNAPIASHTISTAQSNGWIWDIGLPNRCGTGYVYSSAHANDEQIEKELRSYIQHKPYAAKNTDLNIRKISFKPGHRKEFWHKNCVAVGMAAGFLEPLEASALALVELSAHMISKELPSTSNIMQIAAKRFNQRFLYRWDRIIEFLKLHYLLSKRTDCQYWRDCTDMQSAPDRLQELLALWRYQAPSSNDFTDIEEIFSSSSYQYILYGMGYETYARQTTKRSLSTQSAEQYLQENAQLIARFKGGLPKNRQLINHILGQKIPA
jgi:flavin-dependent dehydrogenase